MDFFVLSKGAGNQLVKSLKSSFRNEFLNTYLFVPLEDSREKIGHWRQEYNNFQLHSLLGGLIPHQVKKGKEEQTSIFDRCALSRGPQNFIYARMLIDQFMELIGLL